MEFRTIVDLPKQKVALRPGSQVLCVGSCFAERIGARMSEAMPPGSVCLNPFGVLYNPESIRQALHIILYGSLFFPEEYLFQGQDGLWHSWLHSGAFSSERHEVTTRRIVTAYEEAVTMLRRADLLCITFGTPRIYEHRRQGFVVGNCHKEPGATFADRMMDVDEICTAWDSLLADLERERPELRIVMTVSPYRYAKEGMHGNQLAKATLLLAIDRMAREHRNVVYFPAYEIVVDELRDYRFYDTDMLHPSLQASDYVWSRFREWSFAPEMQQYADERAAIARAEAHRPLHPGSEEHRKFEEALRRKREAFEKKWKTENRA